MAKTSKEIKYNEEGVVVCGARLVTPGGEPQRFCDETDVFDNGRCRIHGGATPKGETYWEARTGRWSPYLQGEDQRKYFEIQRDSGGEVLSLEDEIHLIDSFIATATENISKGGSAEVLVEIAEAFDAYQDASAVGDKMTCERAMQRLERAIERGRTDGEARMEISKLVELRARLCGAELKHQKEKGKFIEVKKVALILSQLTGVLARVPDVETRRFIITEFRSIIKRTPGGAALLTSGGETQQHSSSV